MPGAGDPGGGPGEAGSSSEGTPTRAARSRPEERAKPPQCLGRGALRVRLVSPLSPGLGPPAPTPPPRGVTKTRDPHGNRWLPRCETGRPALRTVSRTELREAGQVGTGLEEGGGGRGRGEAEVGRSQGVAGGHGLGRGVGRRGGGGWPGLQVTPPGHLHHRPRFSPGRLLAMGNIPTHSQIQGQEFPPEAKSWDWAQLAPQPHSLCGARASSGSSAPGRARTLPCHLVVSWASHCSYWALALPAFGCWDNQSFPRGRPGPRGG